MRKEGQRKERREERKEGKREKEREGKKEGKIEKEREGRREGKKKGGKMNTKACLLKKLPEIGTDTTIDLLAKL